MIVRKVDLLRELRLRLVVSWNDFGDLLKL